MHLQIRSVRAVRAPLLLKRLLLLQPVQPPRGRHRRRPRGRGRLLVAKRVNAVRRRCRGRGLARARRRGPRGRPRPRGRRGTHVRRVWRRRAALGPRRAAAADAASLHARWRDHIAEHTLESELDQSFPTRGVTFVYVFKTIPIRPKACKCKANPPARRGYQGPHGSARPPRRRNAVPSRSTRADHRHATHLRPAGHRRSRIQRAELLVAAAGRAIACAARAAKCEGTRVSVQGSIRF